MTKPIEPDALLDEREWQEHLNERRVEQESTRAVDDVEKAWAELKAAMYDLHFRHMPIRLSQVGLLSSPPCVEDGACGGVGWRDPAKQWTGLQETPARGGA